MKSSGITRRIDELGRIVVPKEMRYNLGIRDGEPLEIYIEDNAIIIKKYSQIANIKEISSNICMIINDICNFDIFITDREKIVASNNSLNNLIDLKICEKHKLLIDERENYISSNSEKMYNLEGYFNIIPIITSNDCSGLVIILTKNKNNEAIKYAKIVERLLVKKLDV